MNNDVLVSICVITYNSSATLLETLESIKEQTYKNIELIISDDCSKDNTVDICRWWLEENRDRFVRTEIIIVNENTGVSANCNRAVKKANGEWIKLIAGDDILVCDGIEEFIKRYKDKDLIVACDFQCFSVNSNGEKVLRQKGPGQSVIKSLYGTSDEQYKQLLYSCFINAPSTILHKSIFKKIGYYDESYKMIEDYPFWLKSTSMGYKIAYLPVLLVYYRKGNDSSISTQRLRVINKQYYKDKSRFAKEKRNPYIPFWKISYWDDYYNEKIRFYIFDKILKDNESRFNLFLNRVIYFMSVFHLKRRIELYFNK